MLKNNTVLKILSLLIAMGLWFYVIGEVNPTVVQTIENIPVQLLNENTLEERDLAVRGSDNFTVDVVLEGRRGDLNRLDPDEIKASADIFGYERGENYVPVQVEVPENVMLKKIKTPKIQIVLEELISVYKEIAVKFNGKTKRGTEAGQVTTNPAEIEVKGAKSAVNAVESVQAEIDASEITDKLRTFTAEPVAISRNGNPVYDVDLSAESVEVETILYHTKTVPLKVEIKGSVPEKYEVEDITVPEEITIKGSKYDLSKIKEVTAEPVELKKITASTRIPVRPKLPPDVTVASDSEDQTIDIKIRGLASKTIRLSTADCIFNHLGQGLSAHVSTGQIFLTITGSEELIEAATEEDFTLSVDLKGLKEGKHTVDAKAAPAETDKRYKSIRIKPKTLQVTITAED